MADRASVDDVAHATARALAQTLRKVGGAPGLPEIAETMRRWAAAADGELQLGLGTGQVCAPRRDHVPTLADPWQALVEEFPHVLCAVPRISPTSVTRLYRAYADEWEDLPPLFGTTGFKPDADGASI